LGGATVSFPIHETVISLRIVSMWDRQSGFLPAQLADGHFALKIKIYSPKFAAHSHCHNLQQLELCTVYSRVGSGHLTGISYLNLPVVSPRWDVQSIAAKLNLSQPPQLFISLDQIIWHQLASERQPFTRFGCQWVSPFLGSWLATHSVLTGWLEVQKMLFWYILWEKWIFSHLTI
jgi:hypothetical protein